MNQSYQYKNFSYLLKDGNHEVVTDPITNEPETVFKYYSSSENGIDALTNSYLFATHPYSFNDSIDSSELLLNFENITFERYVGLYKKLLIPEEFDKYDFNKLFPEDKANSFAMIRKFFYEYFSRKLGLISLTTQPLNILMWSHYSSESGFIIELDKNCLIQNLRKHNAEIKNFCFRPVQYVDELESIDMFQDGFTTPDVSFLYMTTVKRIEWKYEDEWRLTVYKTDMGIPFGYLNPGTKDYEGTENRIVFYSRECIKSIFLGKHFINGKNCSAINLDQSFTVSNDKFIELINHLYENHNDKLFMSGEIEKDTRFGRSVGKIKIEKINNTTFKIIDLKEGYSQMK